MKRPLNQFHNIDIDYNDILVRLGYASGKTVLDDKTKEIIETEITIAKKLLAPGQVISNTPYKSDKKGIITLEEGLIIKSLKVSELFSDSIELYGFAVTIGKHLEEKRDIYVKEGEKTRALILDAVGSVAAETLAKLTNKEISDLASKKGLTTTRRFSPGYGDWDISGQKDLLIWLGANEIGIKLSDTYQMQPEKSVSAVLGVKKNGH